MLTSKQRETIALKAAADGQFAIAAAILTLAQAVRDTGPPVAVQALDLCFLKVAEATRDAGLAIAEGLDQMATATRETQD